MKTFWRGYPVAQHLGDMTTEYRGHHLEVTRNQLWTSYGWVTTWDAWVDDNCVASHCSTKDEAKQACVHHADQQEEKS